MKNPLVRRLAPLFIAKFLLCFVFWYSIEKLFMYSIGFNDASIGLMAAIYAVMSVFMEVPSGVLADRWSRKGVMILSGLSMLLSSYFGWISNDPSLYVVSAAFWGFFDALASGTGSAMIYDLLKEEQGHTRNYDKILGRFEMLGGIALIISALLGGWLASARSLRSAFFATIITAGLAAVVLLFYRDTTIHKQSTDAKLIEHTKGTFAAVFKNPDLAWLVVVMLVVFLVQKMNGEFYQLWYAALSMPAALFGIAGAIITGTYSSGGAVVRFFATRRRILLALAVCFISAIGMTISPSFWLTVGLQFIIGTLSFALVLALTSKMQHYLPSKYRAGAGSVINTVGRLIFIPCALLFGFLSNTTSIFVAGSMTVVFIGIGLFAEFHARREK